MLKSCFGFPCHRTKFDSINFKQDSKNTHQTDNDNGFVPLR